MTPARHRGLRAFFALPANPSGYGQMRSESPVFALLMFLAFSGLALLMTFPLALHWRDALPGGDNDVWQNYWNFWWWKQSLLEWHSPFWSSALFHPFGVELRCYTHSVFNQVLAMPVNLVLGEAAAHNFCVFFQRALSAFAAWLLVRELTGNRSAALLGGLIFGFFPYAMERSLEQLNLTSTGFLPLVLFFLLRWRRSRRLGDAVGFGACFGLNALCSWHLGILCSLVVAPALLLWGWRAWRANTWRPYVRGTLGAAGIGALLTVPVAPLGGFLGAEGCVKGAVVRGIDPTHLLTPSYANPIAGALVSQQYANRADGHAGLGERPRTPPRLVVCYLGFVPLGLATLAVLARFRRLRGWFALFAASLVLALGSPLVWDGVVREGVLLPFAVVRKLPVLEHLRVADRFMPLAGLALAVLAAHGAMLASTALLPRWRRCALPLAAGLLLVEYSWLPYPLRPVEHSPLLKEIAGRPGAVLDVPFLQRPATVRNQVAQVIHGRPIAGGYVTVPQLDLRARYVAEPALTALACLTGDDHDASSLATGAEVAEWTRPPARRMRAPAGCPPGTDAPLDIPRLRELGFGTLVIHKQSYESEREEALRQTPRTDVLAFRRARLRGGVSDRAIAGIRSQLDAALGGAALEDDQLAIYFLEEPQRQ